MSCSIGVVFGDAGEKIEGKVIYRSRNNINSSDEFFWW